MLNKNEASKRTSLKLRFTKLGVTLVCGVLIAVAAECAASVYYFMQFTEFPWRRPGRVDSPQLPDAKQGVLNTYQMLSPFFGFTIRPGWSWRGSDDSYFRKYLGYTERPYYLDWGANNYGFLADVDYPYAAKTTDFIVGVFGGSVAQYLALDARAAIKKNLAATGKNVVILNFANGGYKQPQAAMILSYFLARGQKFDLILNMDGLNEGFIGWENFKAGIEPLMPPFRFVFGLQNLFASSEDSYTAALAKRNAALLDWKIKTTRFGLLAWFYILEREKIRFAEVTVEREQGIEVADRPYVVTMPRQITGTWETDGVRKIADAWASGSIQMKALADASGAKYLHLLQPNQYFGNRPFIELQNGTVPPASEPWAEEIVGPTYRALLERVPSLQRAGVNFIDLTRAFDSELGNIYYDNCCHFNLTGYSILMERIIGPKLSEMRY